MSPYEVLKRDKRGEDEGGVKYPFGDVREDSLEGSLRLKRVVPLTGEEVEGGDFVPPLNVLPALRGKLSKGRRVKGVLDGLKDSPLDDGRGDFGEEAP